MVRRSSFQCSNPSSVTDDTDIDTSICPGPLSVYSDGRLCISILVSDIAAASTIDDQSLTQTFLPLAPPFSMLLEQMSGATKTLERGGCRCIA